ncbi:hypothetical protein ABVT39_008840 [Epinephelus coioides]
MLLSAFLVWRFVRCGSSSVTAPLMTPSAEIADLKSELQSIERHIDELLQRQTKLYVRLMYLEPVDGQQLRTSDTAPASADVPRLASPRSPSWVFVVKDPKRLSLPPYDLVSGDDFPLSNFFSPLAEPIPSPSPPVCGASRPWSMVRKRSSPTSFTLSSGSLSPLSAPIRCKRPRLLSPPLESSVPALVSLPPLQPPAAVPLPPAGYAPDQVVNQPAHLHLASSLAIGHRPKLATYTDNLKNDRPEILVVGDSIFRFVRLPGAITYCLSGAKTDDLIELIPTLLDIYPSVHAVISHSGTNDVMSRQSTKLHYELESLVTTET